MIPDKWYLSKLYQLIGRRPRTTKEIREWLKKRKASDEQITTIIDKLLEINLLDDLSYTHAFIRTQQLMKSQSSRQLIYKLQKKGISSEMVKQVLEEEGHDDSASAKEEIRKNMWRWAKFDGYEKKQKMMTFLMRKGFSLDVIKKATNADSDE